MRVDIHKECANAVDLILAESVRKKTLDNITVVLISFTNFKRALVQHTQKGEEQNTVVVAAGELNDLEFKNTQRQVMTEVNSARTSRQTSEEHVTHKDSISPTSNKVNYFAVAKKVA